MWCVQYILYPFTVISMFQSNTSNKYVYGHSPITTTDRYNQLLVQETYSANNSFNFLNKYWRVLLN